MYRQPKTCEDLAHEPHLDVMASALNVVGTRFLADCWAIAIILDESIHYPKKADMCVREVLK